MMALVTWQQKEPAIMMRDAAGRLMQARLRSIVVAAVLGVLVGGLILPALVLAKSFGVTGTIDCGLPNGDRCEIGDEVALWTSDITGTNERFVIDVSWIKKHLDRDRWDQEDMMCLEVD